MTEYIQGLDLQNPDQDWIEVCESKGLTEYEKDRFLDIRQLGKGAFGEVRMCYDLLGEEKVAVKSTKIKSAKDKIERITNLASFLREKDILELIKKEKVECVANFIGAYYKLDEEGDIDSLILVSESGEYSLDQLLKARGRLERKQKNLPIYSSDEVIGFIAQISEAYKALQELNIYHSDTKLQNLVYSKSKRKFLLIDFGVSKLVKFKPSEPRSKSNLVKIEDYATGGTNEYFSPEKKSFWDWRNGEQNDEFNEPFDPFKCDMWSLGVCIEKMIGVKNYGENSEKSKGKKFLLDILKNLKEKDWQRRFNALELHKYIEKHKLKNYTENSGIVQKDFNIIVALNKERYENQLMKGIRLIKIKKLSYELF